MEDSKIGCIVGPLIWILTIGISIGSGIYAWNWMKPDSFFSVVGFLIMWAIISKIGHFVVSLIIVGIGSLFGE